MNLYIISALCALLVPLPCCSPHIITQLHPPPLPMCIYMYMCVCSSLLVITCEFQPAFLAATASNGPICCDYAQKKKKKVTTLGRSPTTRSHTFPPGRVHAGFAAQRGQVCPVHFIPTHARGGSWLQRVIRLSFAEIRRTRTPPA